MGCFSKRQIENFARKVFKSPEFINWQMEWTEDSVGMCARGSKIIYIPKRMIGQYPWVAKEYVLHEVAHIYTEEDSSHGENFYKEYIRLLNQFMSEGKKK